MSIRVNDFQWIPGKNDAEYIKLLESSRDEWQKIAQKAITKLKTLSRAQEPHVMTHEEVINLPEGAVAWFEEMNNGSKRYIQPMMSNGKAFMIGTYVDINVSRGTFNWTNRRFWTSRPTYELMEATPWQ